MPDDSPVTRIIADLADGSPAAAERLLPYVYEELRALAISFFQQQPAGHTLQPTALVHEAYLKLVGGNRSMNDAACVDHVCGNSDEDRDRAPAVETRGRRWESRKHFFAVAAMAMRQLLADHARRKATVKRGGDAVRVSLNDSDGALLPVARDDAIPISGGDLDVEALDAALTKLASLDSRQARIIELRYLAGLTNEQTADVLGVSERTVRLEWQTARAWLRRELAG